MKILWLSHLVPYPPKAGVLLRSHYLVKELAKHHEVHLIAFNQRALIEPYFPSYKEGTQIAFNIMKESCPRVEFVDCPMDKSAHAKKLCALRSVFSRQPYTINWLTDQYFQELVNRWHQEEQYDLVHCDTISLAPYVNSMSGTLLSLDHHNVESHMLTRRSQLENNLLKKFYYWQEGKRLASYEKAHCHQFHTNITCSELDSERLLSFCPDAKFTEIPNGVDIEMFVPATVEPDPAHLIFIGTLDWYPNTRAVRFLANKIWPKLKKRLPDAKVTIIGAGAPEDLLNLSRQDAQFDVLGYVDDLKPHLDSATVYVCPIDDGGGTKLKILDAFAAGKAVVAHTIACEGLHVESGKQALLTDDADGYVECILEIVNNKVLRKEIEKNARDHAVQHFSFSSIGKKLADHYGQLDYPQGKSN